jgi:pimeloyl-ACP methyl ester carboxylesterase
MPSMQIDGRRFAWSQLGDGPPLVLVNGYAASSADWDPTFTAALARAFTLICPDNRGTGDSELGDPDALTVDAMADDVETLVGELGLGRPALAGWSMGGYVVQHLALRSSACTSAIALLATGPGGGAGVPAEPYVWGRLTDHSGAPREQATRLISLLFPPDVARSSPTRAPPSRRRRSPRRSACSTPGRPSRSPRPAKTRRRRSSSAASST